MDEVGDLLRLQVADSPRLVDIAEPRLTERTLRRRAFKRRTGRSPSALRTEA